MGGVGEEAECPRAAHHLILLLQFSPDETSRTYLEFEKKEEGGGEGAGDGPVEQCVKGLCNIFEQRMKVKCPEVEVIKYEVGKDLFEFVD